MVLPPVGLYNEVLLLKSVQFVGWFFWWQLRDHLRDMYADGDDQWKGHMDDAEEICKKECIEGKRIGSKVCQYAVESYIYRQILNKNLSAHLC